MPACPACNMDYVLGMEECPGCGQTLGGAAPAPYPRPASSPASIPVPARAPVSAGPSPEPEKPRNWLKIIAYLFAGQFVLGWLFLGVMAVLNPASKPPVENSTAPPSASGAGGEISPAHEAGSSPAAPAPAASWGRIREVYAPISYAATMAPLMGVMAEKGYGNITGDDIKPAYRYSRMKGPGGVELNVQVVYTDTGLMKAPATYVPMSLMQSLRRAAGDPEAEGLAVDPDAGDGMVLDKGAIHSLLENLKGQGRADADLPFTVMRLMEKN